MTRTILEMIVLCSVPFCIKYRSQHGNGSGLFITNVSYTCPAVANFKVYHHEPFQSLTTVWWATDYALLKFTKYCSSYLVFAHLLSIASTPLTNVQKKVPSWGPGGWQQEKRCAESCWSQLPWDPGWGSEGAGAHSAHMLLVSPLLTAVCLHIHISH